MWCGTSERVPVSLLIHLFHMKRAISTLRTEAAYTGKFPRTWATSAASVRYY